ncbi:MAG: hypothetical protein OXI66_01005 [Boseongicola sp.]|nr:hypothetical protein [Boseongicola sp.]
MDELLAFEPEILGPGHAKPLIGEGAIKEVLTSCRDAIRNVVDATRDGMDGVMTIDELTHAVNLPEEPAKNLYLRECCGRMNFAVRAYFVGARSWLEGIPTSLGPLSPWNEAERFIKLADGADAVRAETGTARSDGDRRGALQLIDRLINAD